MTMSAELRKLLLNRPRGKALIETIELSHSLFSKTYYLVRNYAPGGTVSAKLETGVTVTYEYVPATIKWASSTTNMDQSHKITIQDCNQIIQAEEARIPYDNTERIQCKLRTYISDDLTTVADGPYELEIYDISYDKKGATFTAKPPNTNETGSGERYTIDRFPCLRGFAYTS